MFKNKKVVVVMPAYNAAQTLKMTYDEVQRFKGKWTDEGLKQETVLGYTQLIRKERSYGT